MLYFFIPVISLFLLSYLFLPRAMWRHYFTDGSRWVALAVVYFAIVIPWTLLSPIPPWGFICGFWLFDPWSYRMTAWPRLKQEMEIRKRFQDSISKRP